jgi:alpha/beta superfamily hydrolase
VPIHAQPVTFSARNEGPLIEGVLHSSKSAGPLPAAVVCHPHPLMGGSMDNPIVVTVCHALAERGWAALRFNFRGTGRSRGSFDDGQGEMDDVAGTFDFLRAQPNVDEDRLAVVGYSFGAGVGLHHAARDPKVGYLVGIALTQAHYSNPFLDSDTRPKLFVAGARDAWAPAEDLERFVARLRPPKTLYTIPRADHFFADSTAEVATAVADFLTAPGWENEPSIR